MNTALTLLKRDLLLAWRQRGLLLRPLLFTGLATLMFAIALGAAPGRLGPLSTGLIWLLTLLTTLLTLETLFQADHADGTLERWACSPAPLTVYAAVRLFSHWLTTQVPLLLLTPLLAVSLYFPLTQLPVLMATLTLGSLTFTAAGSMGVALTIDANRSNLLLPLIVLPFWTPALILGTGTTLLALEGLPWLSSFYLLAALTLATVLLAPAVTALGLNLGLRR